MATKDWRTEVRLTVDPDAAAEEPEARERSAGNPFVVAVLGDFGVAAGRESAVERGPRLVGVDRDNFDALFGSLAPRWRGPVPGGESGEAEPPEAEVVFRSLDDFHPDRLVETVPALRALLEARRAVNDPARFEAAAEEVARRFGGKAGATETEEEPRRAATTDAGPAPGGGLLDRILEQAEPGRPLARPAPPRDEEFARLLAEIVAPHRVRVDAARQAGLVRALDAGLSAALGTVLHDPTFQSLESAWRGISRLVRAVEDDSRTKIVVFPCGKEALARDLGGVADVRDSTLGRLLIDAASVPGAVVPALLVGLYDFDHSAADVALLERLGQVAGRLRAPFVGALGPSFFGRASFADLPAAAEIDRLAEGTEHERWNGLRRSASAAWLCLALPRLLGRLPFGRDTDPIEAFDFDETAADDRPASLLWGNPALAVAEVVIRAFAAEGWALDPARQVQQLDSLPLCVHRESGEAVPCAEVWLSERVVDALSRAGVIPLVSHRGRDLVALPCLQTLSVPARPLAWRSRS